MHSITQPPLPLKANALWFLFGTSLLEGRVGRSQRQGAVEGEEKAYLASLWPSKWGSVGSGEGLALWSLVLAVCSIGGKGGFEEEKSSPGSQLFQNPYSNFHSLAVILHTFLFTQLPILDSDLAFQLHPSNLLILIPNLCSHSVQLLSCIQLFATPWTANMLDLPVHHQLPESTQTHVHLVGDAIQPSQPLSFPSPTFNLSQDQSLFK